MAAALACGVIAMLMVGETAPVKTDKLRAYDSGVLRS